MNTRNLMFACLVLPIAGCSMLGDNNPFRDRTSDYLQADSIEPMQIPDELNSGVVGQLYPIPEVGNVPEYQLGTSFEVPRVEANMSESDSSEVKIQRLGDDSWILASVPPGETWPRVRNYLSTSGIPTSLANASTGVIETGWFSMEEDAQRLQQFRLVLQQGVQLDTTEIAVYQRQYAADAIPPQLPEWSPRSDDLEMEEWMRTNLAQSLASEQDLGSASLLGQEIGAARKVELVTPETTEPYLMLYLPIDRASASLRYALETSRFELLDYDTNAGHYQFHYYTEPHREISWFAYLFGRRNAPPTPMQLKVEDTSDGFRAVLRDASGQPADPRESFIVLTRIRNNLT